MAPVKHQSVHTQRWTRDPQPPPTGRAPPGQAASVPGAATTQASGDRPGGGPSAGDWTLTGGGGRGKEEGSRQPCSLEGWGWALSGCSSSGGGQTADGAPYSLEALRLLLGQPVLASATVSPPQGCPWARVACSSVSEFAVNGPRGRIPSVPRCSEAGVS